MINLIVFENSDGPIVKVVARFFYLASLMHSSENVNTFIHLLCLSVCL